MFSIENLDIEIEYRNGGPWRSYHLTTSGYDAFEMVKEAGIEEVDQDGGTLRCYSLEDAGNEIQIKAIVIIKHIAEGK